MYATLGEIEKYTGGEILSGDPSIFVGGKRPGGISIDSRSITDGEWFAALAGKGGRDGHDFLDNAVVKGAAGLIISDRDKYELRIAMSYPDLPVLLVPDTTAAFGQIATGLLAKYGLFVIGITGSVGKTSVKENIAHITGQRWPTVRTIKNWNTEIGVPLTIFELTPDDKIAVIEMAARGVGQIRQLSMIARPHVAVITFIGLGHLSEFGSRDAIVTTKWGIVDGLRENGVVIVNGDQHDSAENIKRFAGSRNVITFGRNPGADIHADILAQNDFTAAIRISSKPNNIIIEAEIPAICPSDIDNAVCAAAAAMQIHIDSENGFETLASDEISQGLATLPRVSGRMETIIRPSGVEVIFDAYNSNPHSLLNAITALDNRECLRSGNKAARKVAILGDMLELGEGTESYHIDAGINIGKLDIDVLITIGENSLFLRAAAEKSRGESIPGDHFQNTAECASEIDKWLKPGDLVLIKASRALTLEHLLDEDW